MKQLNLNEFRIQNKNTNSKNHKRFPDPHSSNKEKRTYFNMSLDNYIIYRNYLSYNQTLDKYLPTKKKESFNMKSQVLVIVSCTKRKLDAPAPAFRLYQGDIFKKANKWVRIKNLHQLIISAKHGLVEPNKVLKPYDKKLKNLSQARALQPKVIPKLRKKISQYEAVVLILGNIYLEVLEPLIEEFQNLPFYRLKSNNGIFDYKKNINKLLNENDYKVLNHYSGPEISLQQMLH